MQPGEAIPNTSPQLFYCPLVADWCVWVTAVGFYWVGSEQWWTARADAKLRPAGPADAPTGWGFRIPITEVCARRHKHPELHNWPINKLDQGEYAEYLFSLEWPDWHRASKLEDFHGVDFTMADRTVQVKHDGWAERSKHVWGQVLTVRKRDIVKVS